MPMKGMDVEVVTEFGNRMRGELASRVQDVRSEVVTRARSLEWDGFDADQFKGQIVDSLALALARLAELFENYGQLAITNARAQADVSAQL